MISSGIDDDDAIAAQMQAVRQRGHLNAYGLKLGVDRLGDWREHVRYHPLAAVGLSVTVGYLVTSSLLGDKRSKRRPEPAPGSHEEQKQEVAQKAGAASAIGTLVGTALVGIARQYVTAQIQSKFKSAK